MKWLLGVLLGILVDGVPPKLQIITLTKAFLPPSRSFPPFESMTCTKVDVFTSYLALLHNASGVEIGLMRRKIFR